MCHHVTVINNELVEPDGIIIINIADFPLLPPNTQLNISEAIISVINDDG